MEFFAVIFLGWTRGFGTKASKFTDAQKAFVLKQGEKGTAVAQGRINHLERMGLVTRSKAGVAFALDMKQRPETLQRSKDEIRSYWDLERAAEFSQLGAKAEPELKPPRETRLPSSSEICAPLPPNYPEIVNRIFGHLQYSVFIVVIGAGDGNRTHDIQLGKLTFYL